MSEFEGANWYRGEQSLNAIPTGSIFLVIDKECYWSKKKAPSFIKFTNSLKKQAPEIRSFMIDFDKWQFPDIAGFPTLLVKTKSHFVKVEPSQNFTRDLANALKIALQNK